MTMLDRKTAFKLHDSAGWSGEAAACGAAACGGGKQLMSALKQNDLHPKNSRLNVLRSNESRLNEMRSNEIKSNESMSNEIRSTEITSNEMMFMEANDTDSIYLAQNQEADKSKEITFLKSKQPEVSWELRSVSSKSSELNVSLQTSEILPTKAMESGVPQNALALMRRELMNNRLNQSYNGFDKNKEEKKENEILERPEFLNEQEVLKSNDGNSKMVKVFEKFKRQMERIKSPEIASFSQDTNLSSLRDDSKREKKSGKCQDNSCNESNVSHASKSCCDETSASEKVLSCLRSLSNVNNSRPNKLKETKSMHEQVLSSKQQSKYVSKNVEYNGSSKMVCDEGTKERKNEENESENKNEEDKKKYKNEKNEEDDEGEDENEKKLKGFTKDHSPTNIQQFLLDTLKNKLQKNKKQPSFVGKSILEPFTDHSGQVRKPNGTRGEKMVSEEKVTNYTNIVSSSETFSEDNDNTESIKNCSREDLLARLQRVKIRRDRLRGKKTEEGFSEGRKHRKKRLRETNPQTVVTPTEKSYKPEVLQRKFCVVQSMNRCFKNRSTERVVDREKVVERGLQSNHQSVAIDNVVYNKANREIECQKFQQVTLCYITSYFNAESSFYDQHDFHPSLPLPLPPLPLPPSNPPHSSSSHHKSYQRDYSNNRHNNNDGYNYHNSRHSQSGRHSRYSHQNEPFRTMNFSNNENSPDSSDCCNHGDKMKKTKRKKFHKDSFNQASPSVSSTDLKIPFARKEPHSDFLNENYLDYLSDTLSNVIKRISRMTQNVSPYSSLSAPSNQCQKSVLKQQPSFHDDHDFNPYTNFTKDYNSDYLSLPQNAVANPYQRIPPHRYNDSDQYWDWNEPCSYDSNIQQADNLGNDFMQNCDNYVENLLQDSIYPVSHFMHPNNTLDLRENTPPTTPGNNRFNPLNAYYTDHPTSQLNLPYKTMLKEEGSNPRVTIATRSLWPQTGKRQYVQEVKKMTFPEFNIKCDSVHATKRLPMPKTYVEQNFSPVLQPKGFFSSLDRNNNSFVSKLNKPFKGNPFKTAPFRPTAFNSNGFKALQHNPFNSTSNKPTFLKTKQNSFNFSKSLGGLDNRINPCGRKGSQKKIYQNLCFKNLLR